MKMFLIISNRKQFKLFFRALFFILISLAISSPSSYAKRRKRIKIGGSGTGSEIYNPMNTRIYDFGNMLSSLNNVMDIEIDGNFIWAATSAGIVRWNMSTKKHQKFATKIELPTDRITSVTVDFNGNKWFGTGRGILLYDGSKWSIFNRNNGLPSNAENILCSTVDFKGNVWFGTRYGGIIKYNGKRWKVTSTKHGLPDNMIVGISFDHVGNAWLSTLSGGIRHNGLNNQLFNFSTGFPSGHVNSIFNDIQRGVVWFGTINGLIGKRGQIYIKHTKREGLPDNNVRAVVADPLSGDLWIGTLRGGVSVFDGADWKTYNSKGDLPSNFVREILIDDFGTKWVATSAGLCSYNDKKWSIYSIEESYLREER